MIELSRLRGSEGYVAWRRRGLGAPAAWLHTYGTYLIALFNFRFLSPNILEKPETLTIRTFCQRF